MANAERALYTDKSDGKSGHAVYDPAPPLVPGIGSEAMPDRVLRKQA